MTQDQYTLRLNQLAAGVADIGRIVHLFTTGQTGLGTLTVIWRFGWKACVGAR